MKHLKTTKIALYLLVILLSVSACKKTTNPPPKVTDTTKTTPPDTTITITPPITVTGCQVKQQRTLGSNNIPIVYQYEYDTNGNPLKVSNYSNGVLNVVEGIQPDNMVFNEASGSLDMSIKYDTQYLLKLPGNYHVNTFYTNDFIIGFFTYDSKSRLSTIKGALTVNGMFVDSLSTTATITYNDNNDVSKITYTYRNNVFKTYTAKNYDTHVTPYHNIKNSWFLQDNFTVFSTDYTNMRYMFDHLSTHNLSGFVYIDVAGNSLTEDYTYTYDDKGNPIQRNAALSTTGQPPVGGYIDTWTYDCK